ncbi:MAG: S9 family peptidase [Gemmatimonadota bacterium]|uniref:S9 family peptidase n=1 Tax=Candidatus Palauibacter scopulicola TaxID=3056741 RepID=UPI00239299BF|nr:S9 family peptidase [Candidatus Palauibacter scopulicola]MDE2662367.1 S9 family peptidase [Candidatus Palauibacter scopulicola]
MARDPQLTAIFGILLALGAAVGGGGELRAQDGGKAGALAIDQLLSIESVVGGAPAWSPDGSAILFESGLTGGLMTLPPEGGFPTRVPVDMGGSGHFLSSQMPAWSPAGTWISYVSDKSGAPEIWLWSARDGADVQLTDLGARINSMSWSPDERSIVFAGDRYGNYDIWKVDVATRRVDRLTEDKRYDVFPSWTPDSRHILYVRLDDAWEDHDVIEVDAMGGSPRTVIEDRDFFDYGAGATFGYPSVSPDGGSILFRSHRNGWINYWLAPREGGDPRPVASAEADQSAAAWSPDGRWIAYTENHNGHHDLRVVSADGGEPRVLVSPKAGVASSPSWSPDGRAIAYLQEDLLSPRDLHVVSLEDGSSRQLTSSMPAGNYGARLVAPEKIRYESTDGYSIPAYLYRPPGAVAGDGLPGVMWIHGGPTSQFHDTFQQHVQFFVQRGYVVLLPNIRGSSGYGKDFADANNGCWGHCDLEDVVAGADYLRALPEVDPERIGITGTSYGGVMSMYAVAFAPDAFRAAIPGSGYTDWVHFHHGENELRHVKLLDHELGPFETSEHVWSRSSSISHVADVSTPILLIHGVGRYPGSDQSEIFARALENHYKPFQYKTYPNENYYVYGKANRRQMLLDMLDFFEQFLRDE